MFHWTLYHKVELSEYSTYRENTYRILIHILALSEYLQSSQFSSALKFWQNGEHHMNGLLIWNIYIKIVNTTQFEYSTHEHMQVKIDYHRRFYLESQV